MKFKHLYYRSEHVAPIVVGMDEISVQFQEIDGLFLFLTPPPPHFGVSSDHIVINPKMVMRPLQGRVTLSFRYRELH